MDSIAPADMVLFAAVVREGGFTHAATRLGVSKQTVSERIAKLEARLGVRLLERTTRRLRLTDSGAVYYERCTSIAAQIEEANHEILERRVEPMGLLRVSAPRLYGRRFLAPVVAGILLRHPKLRVQIVLADRRVDLVEEGFDLAIRIGAVEETSFAAKKLGEGYVHAVASPALVTGRSAPDLGPKTIRSLPAIAMHATETWQLGETRIKVTPRLVVNDLEVACEAAIAGVGVALLPSLVCRDAVADGRLIDLLGQVPAFRRPVFAVFPSRRHLPPKVRIFLDALGALIAPMAPLAAPTSRVAPRRASRAPASR
jgi:DNA-binding transcriptional LysR family regulator